MHCIVGIVYHNTCVSISESKFIEKEQGREKF